jgi:hypothetical protein
VVERFTTAEGVIAADPVAQTLILTLPQADWDAALRDGLPWRSELTIPAHAVELKLLFANRASGRIGTLAIPLVRIKSAN